MTQETRFSIDRSWGGVIRWGGFFLSAAGCVLIVFVLAVLVTRQTLPVPAEDILRDPTRPTLLFLLAAFGELLLMPGVLGLYSCLKDVRRTPAFIATALWLVAVPMFLVSRGLILSVARLSGRYLEATSESLRAAYVASAELALEAQNVYAIGALILLCVASIIMGVVLLNGVLGRRIGYVAILAGFLTVFSPFGVILGIPVIIPFIGLILTAVWQIVVGARLFRMGEG